VPEDAKWGLSHLWGGGQEYGGGGVRAFQFQLPGERVVDIAKTLIDRAIHALLLPSAQFHTCSSEALDKEDKLSVLPLPQTKGS
jgi:hypothetical protein